jgi:hypothetical protein
MNNPEMKFTINVSIMEPESSVHELRSRETRMNLTS